MFSYLCLLLKRNGGMEPVDCNLSGSNPMWIKSVGEVDISDLTYILGSDGYFNKRLFDRIPLRSTEFNKIPTTTKV